MSYLANYNSIDNIPYWNWVQVRRYDDLRYLYELDSYLNIDDYKVTDKIKYDFQTIESEYSQMMAQRPTGAQILGVSQYQLELEAERTLALMLLAQVDMFYDKPDFKCHFDNCITDLDNLGYEINTNLDLAPQLLSIKSTLDSMITEIDELEKQKESMSKGAYISEEAVINQIEKYKNTTLDTKKISLLQFLEYERDYLKFLEDASNKKK